MEETDKSANVDSALLRTGRRAGVGMHISSLPGEHGVGDIADSAVDFVDRLANMNIGVWQFLPLGPTAYGDSPYQPLSAFAGNANLVGMAELVRLGLLAEYELAPLATLPAGFTDYGRLIPVKEALLALAAERFHAGRAPSLRSEYEEFLHGAASRWLEDYALFRALKSAHGERPWPEWETAYVRRQPGALAKARDAHAERIENTRVKQFLFDRQWRRLRAHAEERGVCLFGDMPIYIALDSSDAWAHRELLQVDGDGRPARVAGVPPDYFSEDGQLWGNPLYDWNYHRETGFRWWIERMRHAAAQSHLVRVDHFRGFEAFWSVPYGETTARAGEWLPGPGDALFEALDKAMDELPIVAEDLGVITPEVDALRENHGIPGMVVLQFEVGDPDFDLDAIGENSVCYTGTHDNDTTQGWFRGNGDDTRSEAVVLATRELALAATSGTPATIHWDMIRLAYASRAALAVAPMQDYLGLDSTARLNTPGTTANNWRWRMAADALDTARVERITNMVQEASRMPADRLTSAA